MQKESTLSSSKTLLISAHAQCPSECLVVNQRTQRENNFHRQSEHKPTKFGFYKYSITALHIGVFLFPLIIVSADFG